MSVPGFEKALRRAVDWGKRGDWAGLIDDHMKEHFRVAGAADDVEIDDYIESLDEAVHQLAVRAALDDYLTCEFFAAGETVITDYLKRRGWNESVPRKEALTALNDSLMSLYEVVAVEPANSLTLRDLLRGGDPVTVEDRKSAAITPVGQRLGLRLFRWRGKPQIARGFLIKKQHRTRGGGQQPHQQFYGGGLSAAVGAQQAKNFSGAKVKGKICKRMNRTRPVNPVAFT